MENGQTAQQGDYDLSTPITSKTGLRQGLASYGDAHLSLFMRKAFIKAAGYGEDALSRPIIGIINTYSGFNPCHANAPQLIEAIKRGVHLHGGLAVEFPTISIHESFSSPTSMFLRNLMAMDTEAMISAQPVDACIMIGGCDKTVPAQLMGGISANKPILPIVTGPMMPGSYKGVRLGACTDCRSNWAAYRAGEMDIEDISSLNSELVPTGGTCGVMATAATMACILVGLGMMPFDGASAPAVSSARLRVAERTGACAVEVATAQRRPQTVLTKESFLNAITVLQAIGGSTNAVVHLMAIVNRHPDVAGSISIDTFDDIGRQIPMLIDLKPSGEHYMTDFHNAGGMLALMHTLRPLLHLGAMTISGKTLGEELDAQPFKTFPYSSEVIRSLANPLYPKSALVILRGNICPGGAVVKASACKDRRLLLHEGPAVVFKNTEDLAQRIDDPDLDVTKDSVLVLQSIGPIGNPGMPEAGAIPIPRKLGSQGVKDMLRLSDGRMSGSASGTIVLHISPESAIVDSVLGIIQDGDIVKLDAEKRSLDVQVSAEEIARRIEARKSQQQAESSTIGKRMVPRRRGYRGLYESRVTQAEFGADFDFLMAGGEDAI